VIVPRHLVLRSEARAIPTTAIEQVIREGIVVEWNPDRDRLLLQERVRIAGRLHWVHVVVSYTGRHSIAIVTAYEPDPYKWGRSANKESLMSDCAFCGSPDVELTTTDFEERRGDMTIRVEGVPSIRCLTCKEGREPALTIGMAKALQAASDLIFNEALTSERILAVAVSPEPAR
jgi:YgiT-type zinc finger domain-containing protein